MRLCENHPGDPDGHPPRYLGNNEEQGDYDLCGCCWSDLTQDECKESNMNEINGQTFTDEQWAAVQSYVMGYARDRSLEYGNRMQWQVTSFHKAMGQPVADTPQPLPADRIPVRVELIREEFIDELLPALQAGDMVETADACIDILYVTLGLLVEMGIRADVLFDEVQASNMSKLGDDGKAIIAGPNDPDGIFEGRVKKGPNYFKPDLAGLLERGESHLGLM